MKPYFDYFFISEHAGAAKPAPAFFDYAFHALNQDRTDPILPQETLIIGGLSLVRYCRWPAIRHENLLLPPPRGPRRSHRGR